MIEETVLNYLETALETVPVYMEVPESPPESFIVIEKTGSSCRNKIYHATLAIQSYAGSMYNAATLNETMKAAMENLTSQNEVASVQLNSDYNYTDTTTKRYRYQAVFDVVHY